MPESAIKNLAGGGEMGQLIRDFDWAATSIGPITQWPQSLLTATSICLASRFPIILWWGPDLILLYNDAYMPIFGRKHPRALGKPGLSSEGWGEVKGIIGPMLNGVLEKGDATWETDQLLVLERHGYPEEAYFTYSYSPIRDESGGVGGVFAAVSETTARVLSERRLRTLRDLGEQSSSGATSPIQACRSITDVLARNRHDVPFVLFYLENETAEHGHALVLAGSVGLPEQHPLRAATVIDGGMYPLPLFEVFTGNENRQVDIPDGIGLHDGAWPELVSTVVLRPIRTATRERQTGVMVMGISPRKRYDDDYRGFVDLLVAHVETAIGSARALQEAKERAEALAELDRAKTDFFSNVSHEFRTPLTLMLGPLEESLGDTRHPLTQEQRERQVLVYRNGQRLLKLVNTLLDFSRIEAGRVQARYEPVELATLTADLASTFRSAIERAGLEFVVDCPPLPQSIYVDREMWEKIVLNLLSNAFKFTFAGRISVGLRWRDEHAELTIADTGTGIPADQLPRLFERFHRVHGARSRSHEGSGIGLALVQELVKLQGGSVHVASELGLGTTFTINLPTGHSHLPAEQVSASRSDGKNVGTNAYVEEALRWLPENASRHPRGDTPPTGSSPLDEPQSQQRLLLADDNADMRDYVARLLRPHWQVETVPDGLAALEVISLRTPDLVISDIMMPRLDGLGLVKAIRADSSHRHLPVILLSARAGGDAHVTGLESGADDYLIKPFSAVELLARVRAHLNLQRVRAEVTAELRLSESRERFLSQASEALNKSLDERVTLQRLAELCVPHLADWCAIDLLDSSGVLQRIAVNHKDPARVVLGFELFHRYPPRSQDPAYQSLADGQPRIVPVISDLHLEALTHDADHLGIARQLGLTGYIMAPMVAWGRALGTLTLVRDTAGKPYSAVDGLVAMELARRASTAVHNALSFREAERARARAEEQGRELARSNAELEQFAYIAAHDLQEPTRMIGSFCQLIERRLGTTFDAQTKGYFTQVSSSVGRMQELIRNILDYSRIGKEGETSAAVDLREVVGIVSTTLQDKLAAVAGRIEAEDLPVVRGNQSSMIRLIQNLVSNGIKFKGFTPPVIRITARREGPEWYISVEDNGIGISPDDAGKIFGLFQRLHASDRYPGTGIGLASCRKIVEQHGGRIWFEPASPQGTIFTFTLPA